MRRSLRTGLYLLLGYIGLHSLLHAQACVTRPGTDLQDAGP